MDPVRAEASMAVFKLGRKLYERGRRAGWIEALPKDWVRGGDDMATLHHPPTLRRALGFFDIALGLYFNAAPLMYKAHALETLGDLGGAEAAYSELADVLSDPETACGARVGADRCRRKAAGIYDAAAELVWQFEQPEPRTARAWRGGTERRALRRA